MNTPQTAQANRPHILILGRTNSGKSSLLNALVREQAALVSGVPGTTTDPVRKAMEWPGVGAVLLVDTAGYEDSTELGQEREKVTSKELKKADLILLICNGLEQESTTFIRLIKASQKPIIPIFTKSDLCHYSELELEQVRKSFGKEPILLSVKSGEGMDLLREKVTQELQAMIDDTTITGSLAQSGDVVVLVMPQDAQAPKGRLILPQVQTIRELLDKGCIPVCCTPDTLAPTLRQLAQPPHLIITDSQAFRAVYPLKPAQTLLTSFSILFAAYKGDIDLFVEGARAIDSLTQRSRVLIAEACAHAPATEDIGTVKIPMLLRKKVGPALQIDFCSGSDFPSDLTPYDLIIHCGACMFNRQHVLSRAKEARHAAVPMTNYGITLAHLTGILDQVALPSREQFS